MSGTSQKATCFMRYVRRRRTCLVGQDVRNDCEQAEERMPGCCGSDGQLLPLFVSRLLFVHKLFDLLKLPANLVGVLGGSGEFEIVTHLFRSPGVILPVSQNRREDSIAQWKVVLRIELL